MRSEDTEARLRAEARRWLSLRLAHGERLLEEVGLAHGECRMDLAVISPRALHGVELKSAADTLSRLPRQVRYYSAVCSTVTLLLAERHLLPAASLVPGWWGLYTLGAGGLQEVRRPAENPEPDALSTARMLWRDEALEQLRELGAARGLYHANRLRLYQALVAALPLEQLRARVFSAMHLRPEWKRVSGA